MWENSYNALRAENNRYEAKLPDEDRAAVARMAGYARSKGLGLCEGEIFRKDLIGMAHGAAERGERLADALGEDERVFCDRVLDGAAGSRWETVLYLCCRTSAYMLFYMALAPLMYGPRVPISWAHLLVAFIYAASVLLELKLARYAIEPGWKRYLPAVINVAALALVLVLLVPFRGRAAAVFTVNWALLLALQGAVFILLRLLWNAYTRGVVKRRNQTLPE